MAALGPQPLLRFGADGQLLLQGEGLDLLRKVGAPVHVAFAIGGSRCGKSTAGNALIFGAEAGGDGGFETGSTFDPVTTGVDVAARPLPGGGALIVGDCEGAFHLEASTRSARGFGELGLLAYQLSTALLHVSMGSIDERDVELLGHLAASASLQQRESRLSSAASPSLMLLVNGARFDMGDAVARKLLRPPEGGNLDSSRRSARAAIARGFKAQPALEALPACEHAAYWPKVDALRRRILETAPMVQASGLQATGADVADRLAEVVVSLGGCELQKAPRQVPDSATEALYRSEHLEPLLEEILERFAEAGEARSSVEQALKEFDRRSLWLLTGSEAVREGLVRDVRARLSARLVSISAAMERGRKQGGLLERRVASVTPPHTPTREDPDCTPSKCSLQILEAAAADLERQVDGSGRKAEEEVEGLKVSFSSLQEGAAHMAAQAVQAERQAAAALANLQAHWDERLREFSEDGRRAVGNQAARSSASLAQLQSDLRAIEEKLPDVGLCAVHLNELRDGLEEERLLRCAAADAATRRIEERLQSLRESLEEEGGNLLRLRESVGHSASQQLEALRIELQGERHQRQERYSAMSEVVNQVRDSLEASLAAADLSEPAVMRSGKSPAPMAPRDPAPPARWARTGAIRPVPGSLLDEPAPTLQRRRDLGGGVLAMAALAGEALAESGDDYGV